ncbi:MAG: cell division protein ZapA [Gammaproteobacteria bacterium]
MSDDQKPVSVTILDKEYVVACKDKERESLLGAVEYLKKRLKEARDTGRVVGSERVAVMTALNIAHEYLEYKQYAQGVDAGIKRMQDKIAAILDKQPPAGK